MRPWLKQILTTVGGRVAASPRLTDVFRYVTAGAWVKQHGFEFRHRFAKREGVWETFAPELADRAVLYLEFGVWQGEATRFWSRRLKHPATKLHGFDSFEGLPEQSGVWAQGQFDVGGALPKIDDPRVKFFKGWFDATLPTYEVPAHDVLFLNMDADLYSSTIYVLRRMRPWIKAGTLIYFDELNHIEHEARAFDELMRETGLRFEAIAADRAFAGVAFRCLG